MQLHFRPENAHAVAYGTRKILVAAKSMSLFVMDPVAEAILSYAQTQPHLSLALLTQELEPRFSAQEVAETVQELVNLHVFLTAERQPRPMQPVVDVSRFPVGSLVMSRISAICIVRTVMNLRGQTWFGPVQMEWETARTSVDFLFEKAGGNREVNLIFFGGEALLNIKLMQQIVAYAEEKGQAAGKKVDFSLTTNGTLLTDEIIDFFQAHRFGVTVSIDGPQDLHDKRRIF